MTFKKNVFVQIDKFNWKHFYLAKDIAKALGNGLYIVLVGFSEEKKEKVDKQLKDAGFSYDIKLFETTGEAKAFLEEMKPDLVIISQEKVDPFIHIFKITDAEKFVKKLNEYNLLLLWEDTEKIEKILINMDYETATEEYVKISFEFASKVAKEFEFIYSFFESFYEYRLRKTHPDEEAKQLLTQMFEEHVGKIKDVMKKAIGDNPVKLRVIKGDPKKEVPYFSRTHKYDLLIINAHIEDRESYIENTENSVGIFLD